MSVRCERGSDTVLCELSSAVLYLQQLCSILSSIDVGAFLFECSRASVKCLIVVSRLFFQNWAVCSPQEVQVRKNKNTRSSKDREEACLGP